MPIINLAPIEPTITTAGESGWTLRELRQHAFFLADEQPNVLFAEADIDRLLNMGVRQLFAKVGYPFVDASFTANTGARAFNLVDAKLEAGRPTIESVLLVEANGTVTTLVEGAETASPTRSKPTAYFVRGENLWLVEDPDAAYTVVVRYKHMPARYTADDSPPLSHDQLELAAIYAVWNMKLKDDQMGNSDRWRDAWLTGLKAADNVSTGVYAYEGS